MNTPGSTPTLRPARLDDAEAIAALATQLGYPTTTEQAVERLKQLLQIPDHSILLAEMDGSIAGWAHVERRVNLESGDRAELMGLVVDAQFRRAGIGKRLVEAVEIWAASRDLHVMVVRSNAAREASHVFYRRLGYEFIKTQHVYQKALREHAHRA